MCDTGSNANLLEIGSISRYIKPNKNEIILLKGTPQSIKTLGKIKVNLCNHSIDFHVVDDNFPIAQDGLMGSDLFRSTNSLIDYEHNYLLLGGEIIPFENSDETENVENSHSENGKINQISKEPMFQSECTNNQENFTFIKTNDQNSLKSKKNKKIVRFDHNVDKFYYNYEKVHEKENVINQNDTKSDYEFCNNHASQGRFDCMNDDNNSEIYKNSYAKVSHNMLKNNKEREIGNDITRFYIGDRNSKTFRYENSESKIDIGMNNNIGDQNSAIFRKEASEIDNEMNYKVEMSRYSITKN